MVCSHSCTMMSLELQHSQHNTQFQLTKLCTSFAYIPSRSQRQVLTSQAIKAAHCLTSIQCEGKAVPEASLPFHRALPCLTHTALVELEKAGILKFVISQNIDSLRLRSGIPKEKLYELHGNSFRELCPYCGAEYLRDFEVETIGLKETSRRCLNENCAKKLKDTVLDWKDALPPKEMDQAAKHCKMADVVLCLGTSLAENIKICWWAKQKITEHGITQRYMKMRILSEVAAAARSNLHKIL